MPKTILLSRIQKVGGPSANTLRARLKEGHYPTAHKYRGCWNIPKDVAIEIIANEKMTEGLIPLAVAARMCGLQRTTLNLKLIKGKIKAIKIAGYWYLTKTELRELQTYYVGTITTTQAAKLLGYKDRHAVVALIRKGFPAVKRGNLYRVRESDIHLYRRGMLSFTNPQE